MDTSEKTVSTGYKQRIQRIIDRCGGQENLATAAGVTQPTVSRWLAGTVPYQKILDRMCGALGLNPRWLLFNEQPEEMSEDDENSSIQATIGHGGVAESPALGDTKTLCEDLASMIAAWPNAVGALQGIVWEKIVERFEEVNRRVAQEIEIRRLTRKTASNIYPYPKGQAK